MIHQEHNKLMYDKYGEQYHLKRNNKESSLWNEYLDIPAMTKLIEKNVNQRDVLDLGCGSGNFAAKVKCASAERKQTLSKSRTQRCEYLGRLA
ncbi:RsmG family class I SAM-dependent methyltransferase [Nostoc sp.]|uniref:RsmG family class I SAM-dependent methyltransferase n=1 Tax=Nostoc sp. TaxID=1180 RepID=UPI002FFA6DD4